MIIAYLVPWQPGNVRPFLFPYHEQRSNGRMRYHWFLFTTLGKFWVGHSDVTDVVAVDGGNTNNRQWLMCGARGTGPFSGTSKRRKEQWRCTQICRTFFFFPINVDLTITKSQFEVVNAAALLSQDIQMIHPRESLINQCTFWKTWQMKHEGWLRQYRAFNPASAFAVINLRLSLWNISLSSSSASKLRALVAYDLPIKS